MLFQCSHQHLFEPLQVNFLHDGHLVLLLQQVHVVHNHHAPGVGPLQLHCHGNLVEARRVVISLLFHIYVFVFPFPFLF